MSIVECDKNDTIGIITMNNGENRHNPDFVREMGKAIDIIEDDQTISSVIITSSDEKNWSLGIDLDWITGAMERKENQEIRNFLYGINNIFKRILIFPVPVIAAINGHAFGDGTILACACDYRFMKSDRGFFSFPEVDIAIPFFPGMLEIVKKAIPYYWMEDIIFTGKRLVAAELEAHHVIKKACKNDEDLKKVVLEFAGTFNKQRAIFGELKKRLHARILETMEKDDPVFIEPLNLTV